MPNDSGGASAGKYWRTATGALENRVTTVSGYQDARRNGPLGRSQNRTATYRASKGRREKAEKGSRIDYHEATRVGG